LFTEVLSKLRKCATWQSDSFFLSAPNSPSYCAIL